MSIWNKRREEEYIPKPASAAPNPVEKKEATPLSSTPLKNPDPEIPRGSATIGKAVKIHGQIFSKEDLYVDGDLEGTIEVQEHKLTIGPNGKVQAGVIKARELVVLGTIQGNVEANERIDIRKDAKLVGDIKTARIVIEDGAYFKGSIDIVKPELAKPTAPPPRPQVASSVAAPSPSVAVPNNAAEIKRY